jgi:hypothetical protein
MHCIKPIEPQRKVRVYWVGSLNMAACGLPRSFR